MAEYQNNPERKNFIEDFFYAYHSGCRTHKLLFEFGEDILLDKLRVALYGETRFSEETTLTQRELGALARSFLYQAANPIYKRGNPIDN